MKIIRLIRNVLAIILMLIVIANKVYYWIN